MKLTVLHVGKSNLLFTEGQAENCVLILHILFLFARKNILHAKHLQEELLKLMVTNQTLK